MYLLFQSAPDIFKNIFHTVIANWNRFSLVINNINFVFNHPNPTQKYYP